MLSGHYQNILQDSDFHPDAAQEKAVHELQRLYDDIRSLEKKSFLDWAKKKPVQGVYLYGGVGRGKSMLMDMFFELLPDTVRKRRVHFHEFMIETHDWLHQARQNEKEDTDDLLMAYAKHVSKEVQVLCFDEFHVVDVTDAMILGRLFSALLESRVILIATSNWAPDRLYEGGLQRQLFLPFIALLKQKLKVVHLDSETDYRQLVSEGENYEHYFYPLNQDIVARFENVFATVTGGAAVVTTSVNVKGRDIPVAAAGDVARFGFSELCEQPLGAEDYIAIAQKFPVMFLENVPQLGSDKRNEAKRFILLIDCLYEAGGILYMSAQSYIENLYTGTDHAFEFQRTVSRLKEMNSKAYCDRKNENRG